MKARRILAVGTTLLLLAAFGACSALDRSPGSVALERGDAAFRAGDYDAAARAYEAHRAGRRADEVDQEVYLRLAVIYLMLGTPEIDPERGETTLEQMVEAHPRGRLREVAETILSLRARIEVERRRSAGGPDQSAALRARIAELERQIEALKAIDLRSREAPD